MDQRLAMDGGGVLWVCPEGNRIRLTAERPLDGRGLYKVWLRGQQGGRMLLGTLAPENGKLRLRRTLGAMELDRAGCWPIEGAESLLAFSFQENGGWYCEKCPERFIKDPELRDQVQGPMLCRREKDSFHLAAPFRTDGPLPLNTLFCLGYLEKLQGRTHVIWNFTADGSPLIPNIPRGEEEKI